MGEVAYRLDLPASSKVHPVFHVSLLRRVLKPEDQLLPTLPIPEANLQVPEKILQQRVIRRGARKLLQALVQWSDSTPELATWEDLETLKQLFPRAPTSRFSSEGDCQRQQSATAGRQRCQPKRKAQAQASLTSSACRPRMGFGPHVCISTLPPSL